ncbi:nitrate/nitrite transporter [Lewinella sp. 4G2]|uniref:MFS transporter n=1 Tax=Lewinella sp. 4G2 TaxID=1803372 RepID=UPI0007B4CB14|nr:MFS transporter [Lewinella sp. 4G2]OAV43156.1 MFS transporter permease [Lewinella sp. 4G2]
MPQKHQPWYYLLLLVLAGESVFVLPFVLPRVFRPTVLDSFGLDNTQLGLCFSAYGVVALLSYLFGGPLADRFPPRKLMATALWLTAAGGIYMATFPTYAGLQILYGYWGFTTIFLFWAAMIKATRIWGGQHAQGRAFGFLDGGRGLVGALFGLLGVAIFSGYIVGEGLAQTESQLGYRPVLFSASSLVALVGVLVWFYLKTDRDLERSAIIDRITLAQVREVLALPAVPLLMVIILCAYTGYKVTDVLSLYAREVMKYGEVDSARVGTLLLFVRPVVGVLIGFLADRSQSTLWLFISFILSALGGLLFASGLIVSSAVWLFFLSTLVIATGVYALRSLYFAVMQQGHIPLALTGTAVGLISLVGYTPDIFAGPMMGYFLDGFPGMEGQRAVFLLVVGFSVVGAGAAWIYHRLGAAAGAE